MAEYWIQRRQNIGQDNTKILGKRRKCERIR
jgi:hypothetical protein